MAQEIDHHGYRAVVPSLRGLADAAAPDWRYAMSAVRAATAGIDSPLVLVAHGDACRVLPAIGRNLPNEVRGSIFVDGCLPPAAGAGRLASERFVEQIRSLIRDGADPRASWCLQEVPVGAPSQDRAVRNLMDERARLPLSYFHDRVPMPLDWAKGRCAYLSLSDEVGRENVARARAYGWSVAVLRGAHHLSIVTDPEAVTVLLLDLAGERSASVSRSHARSQGAMAARPPHMHVPDQQCLDR